MKFYPHSAIRELGFIEMFATSAIRRLRGRGVPVTSVLTERDTDLERARQERIRVCSREDSVRLAPGGCPNEDAQPREFVVPPVAEGVDGRLLVDTAADPPEDVYPEAGGPGLPNAGELTLTDRSLRCYVAQEAGP